MKNRIRLGISSCLLGERVRYDGGHKLDHYLKNILGQHVEWVGVCPEVESGLAVPREAMRLVGDKDSSVLIEARTNIDHTGRMLHWATRRLKGLEQEGLCGFVFKSKSPSCGMRGVKVHRPLGAPAPNGMGVFAQVFIKRFPALPVDDEGRLQDLGRRENFIERVFVYRRWKELAGKDRGLQDMITFHADHKLLILSHSAKHYSTLGRLVAHGEYRPEALHEEYLRILMEGLRLEASVKKHTNVLRHAMGYFKAVLSRDEKDELLKVIGDYHKANVPLLVPVTLMNHYVRKYDEPYLKRQYYLNPHPDELMLRNHV